ncbi:hypothetical protein MHN79_09180 [Vibrio sp. Of14-4]|uniref:DUF7033 domain-containing protein n=1 Tax=Vibrio sp. Of14-4 TaxID=2724878 RepID=UPI001EF3B712|nr:hypothetical protein [Vibrio sp. Of14-4]MCG7489664.1 hypothetical protein [Vibrio sp. Of14-4]
MINIYIGSDINLNSAVYTFEELFRYIDINFRIVNSTDDAHIIYDISISKTQSKKIIIEANFSFWKNYLKEESMPRSPLGKDESNNTYAISNDIIASAFFLLSGYEEYINTRRDRFDRFLYQYSLYKDDNLYNNPLVDTYRDSIVLLLNDNGIKCSKVNIWSDKAGIFLTHDVDGIYKYRYIIPSIIKSILKPSKFNIIELVQSKSDIEKDPYYHGFYKIIQTSLNLGFKSTFFFITNPTCKLDNFYHIHDKNIVNAINLILNYDFEVGIHGSLKSYDNDKQFLFEKSLLGKNVLGGRQHYLKYTCSRTSKIHGEHLCYDSTLGFPDMIGFRRGTCMPFKVFDLENNTTIDIFEFPLLVMDQTLKGYMNLNTSVAYQMVFEILQKVEKYHGLFTFLWHPGNCSDEWDEWFNDVYIPILKSAKSMGFQSVTGADLLSKIINESI